ncbi:MAG TPA: hypothetical protein PLV58_11550, partial [Campylobacterales bacterium]|nr:hypothetical protein [Campylobacterales bacterium]
ALNELKEEVNRFVFIAQIMIHRNQSYIPTQKALKAILGEKVELNPELSYEAYMQKLHSATICLDAYPFGGFNTIVDALHLGKPVVTWEGTKAYNRLASAVLRRLGLCELIATSKEEYVSIATRLLTDKAFYDDICARIASLDIDALLYTREDELEDFVSKIKMIIDGEIKRV